MNKTQRIVKAVAEWLLRAVRCSPAPTWYTANEIEHYLCCRRYGLEIARELADDYAHNLQKAYEKGYDMGRRKGKQENTEPTHSR